MGINEAIMRAIALVLALITTPALADVAGVASVIDGDSIEVHGQRIRLHGIDARMSDVRGKADVPATWPEGRFLAKRGHGLSPGDGPKLRGVRSRKWH